MARANLGQLLGNVGETIAPAAIKEVEPESLTQEVPLPEGEATVPAARPPSRPATEAAQQAAKPAEADPGTPAYLRYVRKETRLREDQQNRLTQQARRLNRAKTSQGARITENSLIRIAVDLFLAQVDQAAGDDEDTIRASLTP